MNQNHGIFKYQYSSFSDFCYVTLEAKFGEVITLKISEVTGIFCGFNKILIYDNYDGIYELDSFCEKNSSFNENPVREFESKSGKMVLIFKEHSNSQPSFFGEYFIKNVSSVPVVFKHQSSLHTVNETHFLIVTRTNYLSVFIRSLNSSVWNEPIKYLNTRSRFHSSVAMANKICVYDSLLVDEKVRCFHIDAHQASLKSTTYNTLVRNSIEIIPLVGPSLVAVSNHKFVVIGGYKPLTNFPNVNVWTVDLSTNKKETLNITLPLDFRTQEKSAVYANDRLFIMGHTKTSLKSESVLISYGFTSSLFEVIDNVPVTSFDKFCWCEVRNNSVAIVVGKNDSFLFFPLQSYWLNISSIVKVNVYVTENVDQYLFYCSLNHSYDLNLKLYYASNNNFWTIFRSEGICLAARNSFECSNILGENCEVYKCEDGGYTCRTKIKSTFDSSNKTFMCDRYKFYDLNFNLVNTNQTRPLCECSNNENRSCINCKYVDCAAYDDCTRCNQQTLCQWNADYYFCETIKSQTSKLVCTNSDKLAQCQGAKCKNSCVECLRCSECGWMLDDWCVPGSLQHPYLPKISHSQQTNISNNAVDNTVWNFFQCPLVNECERGNHNCSAYEVCVDKAKGWTCICKEGYERPSTGEECGPVCTEPCLQGKCVGPNVCECSYGFYGNTCGLTCPCNRNSHCDVINGEVKCLKCENNTFGRRCQFCKNNYVGMFTSEKNKVCLSCRSLCNEKTDECSLSSSGVVTCRGCQGNTRGQNCENCKDGFFLQDDGCRRCRCNNEDNRCNPNTGGNCKCGKNAMSSKPDCNQYNPPASLQCWRYQCDKCKVGYVGQPSGSSFCYKWLHNNDEHCFDPDDHSYCYNHRSFDQGDDQKEHLDASAVVAYALQPKPASKADYRVYVDVWAGEVDVFLVYDSQNYFVIERNNSGEHVKEDIGLKLASPGGLSYKKVVYKKSEHMHFKIYHVTMKKLEALKIERVAGRLVVTRKFTKKDRGFLYVIVRAVGNKKMQKRSLEKEKGASGRITFRQDEPRLDLFVFFTSFFSLCGILSVVITSVWKFRRMVNNRRARINHQLQMIPLARRPCRLVYICIDDESQDDQHESNSDDEKPLKSLKGILNKKSKSADQAEASRVKSQQEDEESSSKGDAKHSPTKMVRFASTPNIVRFEVPEVERLKTHCRPLVVQPTSSNESRQAVITYIATLPSTNHDDNRQKPVVFLTTLASIERQDHESEDLLAEDEKKKRRKFLFFNRDQSEL